MRSADQLTAPIEAADTDRLQRWPASNTLIDLGPGTPPTATDDASGAASAVVVESRPQPDATALPQPYPLRTRTPGTDAPIPAAGDLWGLDTPDPVLTGPLLPPRPYRSVPIRRRTAPASSAALTLALLSMPLVLLGGVGVLTGFTSIVCAAFGIRQIRKQPQRYRGNGRNVAAIMISTGCMIVGAPLLLLALLVIGL